MFNSVVFKVLAVFLFESDHSGLDHLDLINNQFYPLLQYHLAFSATHHLTLIDHMAVSGCNRLILIDHFAFSCG